MEEIERGLLEAIGEHPDDEEPRLVYADWLGERGDPRGELITALCMRAAEKSEPRREQLKRRVKELVGRHGTGWFGPLGVEINEAGSYWFERLVESMDRGFFKHPLFVTEAEHRWHHELLFRLSPVLYVMEHTVAEGRQNTVIKGRRVTPIGAGDRPVCIKRPALDTSPDLMEDLVQQGNAVVLHEARVVGLLDHPNVVRLEGVGRRGDGYVAVLEWLEGVDLACFDRQPLDPPVALELAAQLCLGLDHLHTAVPGGAVHNALRPDNVMLTAAGQIKLLDFARTTLGDEAAPYGYMETGPALSKGRFNWLSPEMVMGRATKPASDIFSVGALLYGLVCGRRPFEAQTEFGVLEAIRDVAYQPPGQVRRGMPPELERVIQTAMQRDESGRFSTALEMHDALRRVGQAKGWESGPDALRGLIESSPGGA